MRAKIISIILILSITNMTVMAAPPCIPSLKMADDITMMCNNIDDILCKDVSKSERRGCSDRESTIFSTQMTSSELGSFIGTCFQGAIGSVESFFTEFIPALCKGIWSLVTTSSVDGAVESSKGFYESTMSVAGDLYNMAHDDPTSVFQKLFSKLTDIIGPAIAEYDCLKPEVKVKKICEVTAALVIPPVLLAKVILRGTAALKEMKIMSKFNKGNTSMPYKFHQYEEMQKKLTSLGYTNAEIDQMFMKRKVTPESVLKMKHVDSAEGLKEKSRLIDPKLLAQELAETKKLLEAERLAARRAKPPMAPAKIIAPEPLKDLDFTSEGGGNFGIIKSPALKIQSGRKVTDVYHTNYLTVFTKNSMGAKVPTSIEVVNQMSDGRVLVRVYDREKQTVKGKIFTQAELRNMNVREASVQDAREMLQMQKSIRTFEEGEIVP